MPRAPARRPSDLCACVSCPSALAEICHLEDYKRTSRSAITLDMFAGVLGFARDARLRAEQAAVLFSVFKALHHLATVEHAPLDAAKAFLHTRLRECTIGLAPEGSGGAQARVFSLTDLAAISEFAARTYLAHYKLYTVAFRVPQQQVMLSRRVTLQLAAPPVPLAEAVGEEAWRESELHRKQDLEALVASASRGKELEVELERYLSTALPRLTAVTEGMRREALVRVLDAAVREFCDNYARSVDEELKKRETALLDRLAVIANAVRANATGGAAAAPGLAAGKK